MMSLQCRCPAPVVARASFRTGRPLSARRAAISHRAARLVTRAAADKDALLKDVQSIIAEQLGTEASKVTPTATFAEDLKADSLDTVEIMMALEEKFDLQMDEEGAEKIQTVQEVVDLIAGQINKA